MKVRFGDESRICVGQGDDAGTVAFPTLLWYGVRVRWRPREDGSRHLCSQCTCLPWPEQTVLNSIQWWRCNKNWSMTKLYCDQSTAIWERWNQLDVEYPVHAWNNSDHQQIPKSKVLIVTFFFFRLLDDSVFLSPNLSVRTQRFLLFILWHLPVLPRYLLSSTPPGPASALAIILFESVLAHHLPVLEELSLSSIVVLTRKDEIFLIIWE